MNYAIALTALLFAGFSSQAHAYGADEELDTSMEMSQFESDEAIKRDQIARDQAVREQINAENTRREAKSKQSEAETRKRDAEKRLALDEKTIQTYRTQYQKAWREKQIADQSIAQTQAKLTQMQQRIKTATGELKAIHDLRVQQNKKMAKYNEAIEKINLDLVRMNEQIKHHASAFKAGNIELAKQRERYIKLKAQRASLIQARQQIKLAQVR